MMQVKPAIVVSSEGLQQAFNRVATLTVKAGSTEAPTTPKQAVSWINSATTNEMRQARKILAHGVIYGAGIETLKGFVKND